MFLGQITTSSHPHPYEVPIHMVDLVDVADGVDHDVQELIFEEIATDLFTENRTIIFYEFHF